MKFKFVHRFMRRYQATYGITKEFVLNESFANRRCTECLVYEPTEEISYLIGVAICNPVDQFSKDVGRKIALKKAISRLPREDRKKIWQEYFSA